jgi:glutamyl-tRNA synthetase
MTISVRYAPSPTGRVHIGNLRPALINYLYARKHGGLFWLRLDDTDSERSKPEYAAEIEHMLNWVGLTWDRYARQSDRMAEYAAAAETLKAAGRLYPAYETPEELSLKRKTQLSQGLPPVYDRAALSLTEADIARLEGEGRKPHWRFRMNPGIIEWPDLVHGMVRFDAAVLGDPIVIREDGNPLFVLSGVVDDAEFGITHVLRGDDHIANNALQIQIFEALGAPIPVFAHTPLLVDADGGKLSKRLGALSLAEMRDQGIEPMALASLLARLGTSDPIEPFTDMNALVEGFDLSHFNRAAARFDMVELQRLSAKELHNMPFLDAQPRLTARGLADMTEEFWLAVRGNLTLFADIDHWWQVAEGPIDAAIEDRDFLRQAAGLLPEAPWDETTWGLWTNAVKVETGKSGKALFMPLRLALTGAEHGPEMRVLLPLIGRDKVLARLTGDEA